MSSELPEDAKCMMDCEAFEILEGIKKQIDVLSEDPSIKIPVSLDRRLWYLKYGNCYTDPQHDRQILEYPFCLSSLIFLDAD
ncbi:hypothetical protein N665_0109s0011 [Sinapis alba]|nr:hypothetical protein N665_0109s0011 [Sinapis alba]